MAENEAAKVGATVLAGVGGGALFYAFAQVGQTVSGAINPIVYFALGFSVAAGHVWLNK